MRALVKRWAVGLGLFAALSVHAQSPRDLPSLFPNRAAVWTDAKGLVRLTLPADVLAACRPDLSDLRLIDSQGREIPYLVDSGVSPEKAFEVTETFRPKILDTWRSTEERDSAPDLSSETYVLETPPGDPEGEAWSLVISASARRFVRAATITARMAEGAEEVRLATTSLFRLPDPPSEKLSVVLPGFDHAQIVVNLVGEEGFFLEPAFLFEARRTLPASEQAVVELAQLATPLPGVRGKTRVQLERPRGLVPDILRIETSTRSLNRRIEVWDEGPGSDPEPLATDVLVRLESAEESPDLEVRLQPSRGNRLEVVIYDGDSRALADLTFHAVLRRPSLVFAVQPSPDGEPAATLFFGGSRAYLPRYDLASLVPPRLERGTGTVARIAERLFDPARLGGARLGPSEANPEFDPTPALAFAMRAGIGVNPRVFSHQMAILAPEAREGLLHLTLSPEVAAVARADLGDLRVVDEQNRQWPYLLERDVDQVELSIQPPRPERVGEHTVYELPLPNRSLRVDQIVLDSEDEFFDRPFEVMGTRSRDGGGEAVLARGRLLRRLGDPREVRIDLRGDSLDALELRVDDGSDTPLQLSRLAVRVPVSELYFAAPAGRYTLLVGNPEQTAPRYELESVRDIVLAVQSRDVDAGQVIENPAFRVTARLSKGSGLQRVLLWGALGLAVLVLTWLTLRLARQE